MEEKDLGEKAKDRTYQPFSVSDNTIGMSQKTV
jgi:hypothetical protein